MANVSVTNTFTNATTADASQVNQNFTDIINGTSDGTKDFSISALTVAGTLTANGNVNLGNSSGDDLTVTASLASSLPIKTTASYDIGSATLGLRALYLGLSTFTTKLATAATSTYTFTLPVAVPANTKSIMTFDASANATFEHRSIITTVAKVFADSPYTALQTDQTIFCDATSGAITVNLPAAASSTGKVLTIKKTDSSTNAITLDGNASETIDGATTTTLNTQYESVKIVCDGSNWYIEKRHIPSLWTAYTPTGTWSSNSTYTGFWKRVGDSVLLVMKVALGGAPTTATLTINLPTSFTIDTAKMVGASAENTSIGQGTVFDSSASQRFPITLRYSSTTAVQPFSQRISGSDVADGQNISQALPMTFATGDAVYVQTHLLPIVGWNG
tara:strand:- start:10856 stop:12025 length:1170 start_codon:yes stop_codon:yes gene_type:complete